MADLKDYSGELRSQLDLRDFSKDFLVKLAKEWSLGYVFNMGPMWMEYIRTKVPDWDEAETAQFGIVKGLFKYLAPRLAKVANIEVRTLADALKVYQLYLEGAPIWSKDCTHEMKSPNHCIMTIRDCPQIPVWENAGIPKDKIVHNCGLYETKYIQDVFLGVLLPDVKVKALKLPYQQEGISCQWDISR